MPLFQRYASGDFRGNKIAECREGLRLEFRFQVPFSVTPPVHPVYLMHQLGERTEFLFPVQLRGNQ